MHEPIDQEYGDRASERERSPLATLVYSRLIATLRALPAEGSHAYAVSHPKEIRGSNRFMKLAVDAEEAFGRQDEVGHGASCERANWRQMIAMGDAQTRGSRCAGDARLRSDTDVASSARDSGGRQSCSSTVPAAYGERGSGLKGTVRKCGI